MRASSPQGRFDAGAARIDGATLETAEAWGKHLLCTWSSGEILHVHLGLIGKFRRRRPDDEAVGAIRLRLETDDVAWQLSGPQTCTLVDPTERDAIAAALGPDPLRHGKRGRAAFVAGLAATRRPIGAVLLDQRVVAGIGNVYRAELLWLVGVHPDTPASQIDAETAGQLWDLTVEQLRRGVEWNRIVTVSSTDAGRRVTRTMPRGDTLYVYKRADLPCRRCGELIRESSVAGRTIAHCPTCQPGPR